VEIATLPDDESAVALPMAVQAGGAVKSFKTTPLLSLNDGIEAMEKHIEVWNTNHRANN
jgi:hypothetical protein